MNNINLPRPVDEITHLFSLVHNIPGIMSLDFMPGTVLSTSMSGDNVVLLIHEGELTLHRKYDGLMLFTISAPFPFGLLSSDNYTLNCTTSARVTLVKRDDFFRIVEENNAWRSLVTIISYLVAVFEEHQKIVFNSKGKYELVRSCLLRMWALPEKERLDTSLFSFIMSRHKISRSTINMIIKALNEGGHITTNRGVLIHVHHIPERF